MQSDLTKIKELILGLKSFKPKSFEPTYLDICRYPASRFEEINSRILSFFLKPSNPHRLGTLFLDVFSDYLKLQNADWIDAEVETEVVTKNGNRIDLLIHSRNCVVCIENKIWADLYNDLDDYRTYVEENFKSVPQKKFMVLSMKSLDEGMQKKCEKAGFSWLYYRDFLKSLRTFVGSVMTECNQRYLSYLIDWIQTLENEENGMGSNFTPEEKKFIQENYEDVKNFMDRISDYDRECAETFNESIRLPIQEIQNLTATSVGECWHGTWFLYQSAKKVDGITYGIDGVNFSRKPYSSEVDSFWIRIRCWGGQKTCGPVFEKLKSKFEDSLKKDYTAPGSGGGRYVEVHRSVVLESEKDSPENLAQWLLNQKEKLDQVLESF